MAEEKAYRANQGKIRWDLLPVAPLRDAAAVLTKGLDKYSHRNWEKGFNWSVPYASAMRHLSAWHAGEDFDPETGLSHIAHAMCNLMMLAQFEYLYPEGDDRPKGTCPPIRTKENVNARHDSTESTSCSSESSSE